MRRRFLAMAMGLAAALSAGAGATPAQAATIYETSFRSIDGDPLPFSAFKGRTVLVVNTASHCGFTHQYAGLQTLWETYRDRGLVVLGVPSRDFNQEYATEAKVKAFCEVNFSIDFPMTEIEKVRGRGAHPFYAWVGAQTGQPRWNFYKYLIGPDGALLGGFGSSTGPENAKLVGQIEAALAKSPVKTRWTGASE